MAVGMNAEQPAALAQRAHQRRYYFLRLEFEPRARAVRLRRDHHVVVGSTLAALRDHLVEKEAVVVAVDHQRDRMVVDRVAGLRAVAACQFLARNGSSCAICSAKSCEVLPVSAASCHTIEVAAATACGVSHGASV